MLIRIKDWDRYGLKAWIDAAKKDCTTMCWRSRSPTSSRESPGPFSTRSATSNARGHVRRRPDLLERGTVLGAVKAKPYGWPPRARPALTALCAAPRKMCRPGRRNGSWHEQRNCTDQEKTMT